MILVYISLLTNDVEYHFHILVGHSDTLSVPAVVHLPELAWFGLPRPRGSELAVFLAGLSRCGAIGEERGKGLESS